MDESPLTRREVMIDNVKSQLTDRLRRLIILKPGFLGDLQGETELIAIYEDCSDGFSGRETVEHAVMRLNAAEENYVRQYYNRNVKSYQTYVSCPLCPTSTMSGKDLVNHLLHTHQNILVEEPPIPLPTVSLPSASEVMGKTTSCPICGRSGLNAERGVRDHMMAKHPEVITESLDRR